MAEPVFSVIVPCYNRAGSVLACLNSVKAQSFGDFECIVVDDGSADGEALQKVVAGLADARFRYIRRENGGGGAARNTGIAAARGTYVAFLDSDDRFLPHKLDYLSRRVANDPQSAWYSQALVDRGVERHWLRPDRGIRPGEAMSDYLFVENQFIQTSTIVMPTVAARRFGFDPALRKGQDLDFCIRLHAAGVRFTMVDEALSIWTDRTEDNRTSRFPGGRQPTEWLERHRQLLTPEAVCGYRANVLAYHIAGEQPVLALRHLVWGWFAGVPTRVVLRQALRCFLPRRWYRQVTNAFVALHGRRSDH